MYIDILLLLKQNCHDDLCAGSTCKAGAGAGILDRRTEMQTGGSCQAHKTPGEQRGGNQARLGDTYRREKARNQ